MPDPTRPTHHPSREDFLVTPRYLAGADDAQPVTGLLAHVGWLTSRDDTGATHYYPGDQRYRVSYPYVCEDLLTGEAGTAWHISERGRTDQGPLWQAVITGDCPPEIIADAVEPLLTQRSIPLPTDSVTLITEELMQADWDLEIADGAMTYTNPAGHLQVRYFPPPTGASISDLRTTLCWYTQAALSSANVLWYAGFSATTPAHVIKSFCDALLNPEPVARYTEDIHPLVRPHLTIRQA
ncbi:DUF317 domain-containing protein [Streptomyces sp. NBRC 109706]|uniref:DUF317 domain-containing protein n=1 Tax=Streptomyces sp. NBRC 109706 TaxID=1550035 RepID=UPI000784192C|nr:DUF317 domain-containing protein [Streptomyces sp. NBRC 109706]